MTDVVRVALDGPIAVVTIDNPPINASSHAVRQGLAGAFERLAADPAVAGIVLEAAGRTFVAGADITEFDRPPQPPAVRDLAARIEAMEKPVVAVLHGTALGGGFELALGCHYRVIDPAGSVGLPEVTLGVIPGGGGTQRLPRLVGIAAAAEIILSGRRVEAAEALGLGLVDALTAGDRVAFARAFLAARLGEPVPRIRDRPATAADPAALDAVRAGAAKRQAGQIAPVRAIEAIARASGPFDDGIAFEAAEFQTLRHGEQAVALRHVFFAERAAAKIPEAERAAARPVERIGVVGGGTMGAGIAASALLTGLTVTLAERDAAAAEAARNRVAAILADSVARGKLAPEARDTILAERFAAVAGFAALAAADLVVEAVFEDMAAKREVFAALDRIARPGAVLATNTSYLDVAAVAAATGRPGDVIGLHFFSPAHVMRLVEIVVPQGAGDEAVATGLAFARALGKIAVRAGVCDGFIGNRVMSAYRKVADHLVEDGASPAEVDAAMRAFGWAMGAFEMQDLAGLDIAYAMRRRQDATRDPRERYVRIADRLVAAGRLGRKTGAGFYAYADGKPVPDAAVAAIVAEERAEKGIVARAFGAAEIQARILAAAVNEAARLLDEGIALRASDVDVVMINGYGFPRWRGGPMHAADARGLPAVLADIERYAEEDAFFWRPAPLLVRLAESGGTFAGWRR